MPKTYSDYVREISTKDIHVGLLANGLFNERLPPFLSSEGFYNYCTSIRHSFTNKATRYMYHENIRNINIPRSLGIPNPMSYAHLCNCVQANWEHIQKHFYKNTKGQSHKISRNHLRRLKGTRAVFKMNYNPWQTDGGVEESLLFRNRYAVKADIANFFPSIYSHSIPWAIAGKSIAKKNKNKPLWYNDLDSQARNIKDGETNGVLIGPHSSNLLSEIILVEVDARLYKEDFKFVRHIDDYKCFVRTYQEGESFLLSLSKCLREFNLRLNNKKCAIYELPTSMEDHWVRRLKEYQFNTSGKNKYPVINGFLDLAIDLMAQTKKNETDSAVLNWAIKSLSRKELTNNATSYLTKTVFHLSILYPYLVPLLDEYVFEPHSVPNSDIFEVANAIFEECEPRRHYEAACFALYYANKYRFRINKVSYDKCIASEDPILLTLGYVHSLKNKDNKEKQGYTDYAASLAKSVDDFEENWLFVYEVLPADKLTGDWKNMKKAGVSFLQS